jgi:dTDP-4-dehydrorhamnose 3,5-epimerase
LYKTTNFYSQTHEGAIVWSDRNLHIAWPEAGDILVSGKDQNAPIFKQAVYFD